jgi:hypothetical protein
MEVRLGLSRRGPSKNLVHLQTTSPAPAQSRSLSPQFQPTGFNCLCICLCLCLWKEVSDQLTTPYRSAAGLLEEFRARACATPRNDPIMSRTAADATRFTATGPYVSSKVAGPSATPYKLPGAQSTKPGSSSSSSGSNPPGETPRQKVERLRAAARAARLAQSTSPVDRLIDAGRNVANKAHKVMIYTLIAASGASPSCFYHYLLSDVNLVSFKPIFRTYGKTLSFLTILPD